MILQFAWYLKKGCEFTLYARPNQHPRVAETDKISFLVKAPAAMFSEPISRGGGERISYLVPTYSALVGVCESNYWKPTLRWRITRVRIINPIQMETKAMLYPRLYTADKPGDADRSFATYLKNVAYQVEAQLVWNEDRPDLKGDRNLRKHMEIARRSLDAGGRFPVFLGKKENECYAYISPCEFGEGNGAYDYTREMSFGLMLHSIIFPTKKDPHTYSQFWIPQMKYGVIEFPTADECDPHLRRKLSQVGTRAIEHYDSRIKPVDETWKEVCEA